MLTLNDIINANFRKSSFSGYRPEDVDAFLDLVKESYEQLIKKNIEQKELITSLKSENEQMAKKVAVLAEKVESYRSEEDDIKNALISAQKLGDASVREARHKAEIIIKDANIKADKILSGAKTKATEYENELESLKKNVSDFRASLMDMYKKHLTLIGSMPTHKEEDKKAEPVKNDVKSETPVPAPAPEEKKEENVKLNDEVKENTETVKEAAQPAAAIEEDDVSLDVTSFEPQSDDVLPANDIRYSSVNFEENAKESSDDK